MLSAVINMTALLGRVEQNELFEDFERCVKSQDPSSIIRVMTELLSVNDEHAEQIKQFSISCARTRPSRFDHNEFALVSRLRHADVRSAVLGGDLTAILRLLSNLNTPQLNKVDILPLEDLKISVTSQEPASIIKTLWTTVRNRRRQLDQV